MVSPLKCPCFVSNVLYHKHHLGSPIIIYTYMGFPGGTSGKEPPCLCRKCWRQGFDPRVRRISWRKAWKPTPVFLPGESYGQRSLAGYVWSMGSQIVGHNLVTKQQQQQQSRSFTPRARAKNVINESNFVESLFWFSFHMCMFI